MTRLLLAVMVGVVGVGCSGTERSCWNEREGQTFNSNGKVVRTCCQDRRYAFMDSIPTGPVTCTPTIEKARP